MSNILTDKEKTLIRELYDSFDVHKKGFIDKRSAQHSTKMLELIRGLQKHMGANENAKVYLQDMMQFYKEFKEQKVRPGRGPNEDIMDNFVQNMIDRVHQYQKSGSFRRKYEFVCLTPDAKPQYVDYDLINEEPI